MDSISPSLQRTILRLVQTHGTIERSTLGVHSRSYDPENWPIVLDDLVDRGLITEDSAIRVGENSKRKQKRAVIVYTLTVMAEPNPHPVFGDMTPEGVAEYVALFPKSASAVAS